MHWHFHRQLYLRYGIVLAPGEFTRIVRAIEDGTALLVEQRGREAIYSVRVMSVGERIYVVAHAQHLITAWPPQRRLNRIRRALQKNRRAGVVLD